MRVLRDVIGETLSGRYCVVSRVAGGGMGEVYKALDLLLDRTVAVKVLQPSLAGDPDVVARFKQEARAAARLSHPNVVAVHDWGSADELTYYMVMEYVDGSDLRNLLVAQGCLHPAHAVDVMTRVCSALSAAHSRGLVHRDVKPENILIARDGTVKVGDFGIAIVADATATAPGGAIPGTLRYLSPEQAKGLEATPASDIWAAGAVLAEALTGQPRVLGSAPEVLQHRAAEAPIPPSRLQPNIPVELDDVVVKACAIDPADRYRDAADMEQDLRRAAVRALPDAPSVAALMADITTDVSPAGAEPTNLTRGGRRRARRRKRARLARAVALVVLLAGLAFAGAPSLGGLFGPRDVKVPALVGLSTARAEERAERAGLVVEVTRRTAHLRVPEGHVVLQAPPRGLLEEGSVVRLVVSTGRPRRSVPSVVGLPLDEATRRVSAKDLRLGEVTRRHADEPRGRVIGQEPEGGELRWGDPVHLVVSKGPPAVTVPQVAGMPAGQAAAALEKAGFTVTTTRVHHDEIGAGRVVSTRPAGGAAAARGSDVEVVVSRGKKLRRFEMPDVRGMKVRAARAKIARLGLVPEVQRACEGGNRVIETDPVAGDGVIEGQRVALFVC